MMIRRGIGVALLTVAGPVAAAAQGFEGVVKNHMSVLMPQGVASLAGADTGRAQVLAAVAAKLDGADPSLVQTIDVTSYLKGSRARNETVMSGNPMGSVALIVDAANDSIFTIVTALRQIMVASGADMAGIQTRLRERTGIDPVALASPPTVTDLGESTLNGARVHGYRLVSDAFFIESWLDPSQQALETPALKALQKTSSTGADSLSAAVLRGKGRAVRSLMIMKAPATVGSGWMVTRMDMGAPEKQPVPDSMFELPADFTRVRLADMMRM